jgi:Spy/CpxP family protein refolding chaperone
MKRPYQLTTFLFAAFALVIIPPASAQEPGTELLGMGQGMDAPADPPMMPSVPSLLLCHRKELDLSDSQVRKLEAVAAGERQTVLKTVPDRLRAGADLVEALTSGIDLDRTRAALDRMAQLRTEATMAHIWAWKESMAILTSEQKTRITNALACMRAMMGMHMMMGMDGMGRMGRGEMRMRGMEGMHHDKPGDCSCHGGEDPE